LYAPAIVQSSGPGILVRIIWFLFVGSWLGLVVTSLAWACNVTIIGLPLGLWLLNRLPTIITLRPQEQRWRIQNGYLVKGQRQHSFWLRALYFVFVGSWFSAVWLILAYGAALTFIMLPLAFWMYGRAGAVTTLYRS